MDDISSVFMNRFQLLKLDSVSMSEAPWTILNHLYSNPKNTRTHICLKHSLIFNEKAIKIQDHPGEIMLNLLQQILKARGRI